MSNVLLGKVIKAMYKLSGKTLPQIAEETGLTIDTINNLFYARIQKPGLTGVCTLLKALGFTVQELMDFMEKNSNLPEDADITEEFTKYISSVRDADITVQPAKTSAAAAEPAGNIQSVIDTLKEEHEKQLDRFRESNIRHIDQIRSQHAAQIEQMNENEKQMEKHYEKSISDLKEAHAHEADRLENEAQQLKKSNRAIRIMLTIETIIVILLAIFDILNSNVGWFR